jgi:hypothetical protein
MGTPETVERPFPELDCSPWLDVRDFVALRRIRTKFRAVDPECEHIHNDPGFGYRYDWVVSPATTKSLPRHAERKDTMPPIHRPTIPARRGITARIPMGQTVGGDQTQGSRVADTWAFVVLDFSRARANSIRHIEAAASQGDERATCRRPCGVVSSLSEQRLMRAAISWFRSPCTRPSFPFA